MVRTAEGCGGKAQGEVVSAMPSEWKKEARRIRKQAKEAGHDMTNFDMGGTSAIASCRNGCSIMAEITWKSARLIALDGSGETAKCPG